MQVLRGYVQVLRHYVSAGGVEEAELSGRIGALHSDTFAGHAMQVLPGYMPAVGAEEAELSEYSALTSLVR